MNKHKRLLSVVGESRALVQRSQGVLGSNSGSTTVKAWEISYTASILWELFHM